MKKNQDMSWGKITGGFGVKNVRVKGGCWFS